MLLSPKEQGCTTLLFFMSAYVYKTIVIFAISKDYHEGEVMRPRLFSWLKNTTRRSASRWAFYVPDCIIALPQK
jgi:hypothetical protein